MKRLRSSSGIGIIAVAFVCALAGNASALPIGWTCTGACGTAGANGVVATPPLGGNYEYVTTNGGVGLGSRDLNIGQETNGSILRTNLFASAAGDSLEFDFDYVTSDGQQYVEYAWAQLFDESDTSVALLFTARTTTSGNTVPGFGLPPITATMTPPSTPILKGTTWAALGGSSGSCYGAGCGNTGWIHSTYAIPTAGKYYIEFGVVNWLDQAYQSGMAISGTTIAGEPITQTPEPTTLAIFGLGLAVVARRFRR